MSLTPLVPELSQPGKISWVVFDFDGVFTDNYVWTNQEGVESVRCWRGDGLGLDLLRQREVTHFVLSSEVNSVVESRCRKLRIPCEHGLVDKGRHLRALAQEKGVPLSEIVYVGNDLNDAGCLEAVGWPIVVKDAHPSVLPLALLQTSRPGGEGAVREVCEWVAASIDASQRGVL